MANQYIIEIVVFLKFIYTHGKFEFSIWLILQSMMSINKILSWLFNIIE